MRRPRRLALLAAVLAVAASPLVAAGSAGAAGPRLRVAAASLIEESTGRALYDFAGGRELPIASTTKLMTALLTLEKLRLGEVLRAPDYRASAVESQIGLSPGERMSVHDLLLALLLPSANDAAIDLAYNAGSRSVGRFVGMMNIRAHRLGLLHTHYSTPVGLDTPGNYSTARDLVSLARYLLIRYPVFRRFVALPRARLLTGDHQRVVVNRNDLVGRIPWIHGVKTGHTSGAGYVMVGSGTQGPMTLISSVLGTSSDYARDRNTVALLGYGFDAYALRTPVRAGQRVAWLSVRDQPGRRAAVIVARTLHEVWPRTARVGRRLELPRQLTGPLRRHAAVGSLILLVNGRPAVRVRLLLAQAVPAVPPLKKTLMFLGRPSTLLALTLLILALVLVAERWRRRTRGDPVARLERA